jgi:hypothetical protein
MAPPAHQLLRGRVAEELGDVLCHIANVASNFEILLDDADTENLTTIRPRWADRREHRDTSFDEAIRRQSGYLAASSSRFVRNVLATGHSCTGKSTATPAGDPLTDNPHAEEGY